jgi:hypothetical protein
MPSPLMGPLRNSTDRWKTALASFETAASRPPQDDEFP